MTEVTETLAARIEAAFASVAPPDDDGIVPPRTDRIGPDYEEAESRFRGRHWSSITAKEIDRHLFDLYLLLTDGAWLFFLPAFLRSAIADPMSRAVETLEFYFCRPHCHFHPSKPSHIEKRKKREAILRRQRHLLSPDQRQVCYETLLWVRTNAIWMDGLLKPWDTRY